MKKGFTLAEVLITLAIIGVVAALTIPVLVQKYQKNALYTHFMKTYNTLSSAFTASINKNGDMDDWEVIDGPEFLEKYLIPFVKYTKYCEQGSECYDLTSAKIIDGKQQAIPEGQELPVWVLADGSDIVYFPDGVGEDSNGQLQAAMFMVDTNGKKGPNIFGQDIFFFVIGHNKVGGYLAITGEDAPVTAGCDPNNSTDEMTQLGITCVDRILKEGKIDY